MIAYLLTALILYPDGHTVTLHLGDNMNGPVCEAQSKVAKFQLEEDLSIAKLISVDCIKGYKL